MLKKTLLATAAIGATLFAVAAVPPALAQPLSSGTSSAPTSSAQTPASVPGQDKRQADDDGRIVKIKHHRDRQEIGENEREGRAVAARLGAGTERSVRSTYEDAKGETRSDGRHRSRGKTDHDGSGD